MTMTPDRTQPGGDEPATRHAVLVTGSAGAVGRAVCAALVQRGHRVRGFDRAPSPDLADAVVADITDPAALDRATADIDTIVHLAAYPDQGPFLECLLGPNIVGVYEVFESATRRESVQRVVLASSIQAVSGHIHGGPRIEHRSLVRRVVRRTGLTLRQRRRPVRVEDPPVPVNLYGATKVFAEQLGCVYSRRGLSVIAARIGWMPRNREAAERIARTRQGPLHYVSPRDVGRFFVCAVEADDVPYAVLFATGPGSETGEQLYDVRSAEQCIGYKPEDHFPAGLPFPWP